MKYLSLLFFCLLQLPLFSQTTTSLPLWYLEEEGEDLTSIYNTRDVSNIISMDDGGLIALGYTDKPSPQFGQSYLARYDRFGLKTWETGVLPWPETVDELYLMGTQILVVREDAQLYGGSQAFFFGYDLGGNLQWTDTLYHPGMVWEEARALPEKELLIVGSDTTQMNHRLRLLVVDSLAQIVYDSTFPASSTEFSSVDEVTVLSDSSWLLVGPSSNFLDSLYALRVERGAGVVWQGRCPKAAGSPGSIRVFEMSNSDFLFAIHINNGLRMVRINQQGTVLLDAAHPNSGISLRTGMTMSQDSGIVLFTNYLAFPSGGPGPALVKYDGSGNLLWARRVPGTNYPQTWYNKFNIDLRPDGGFACGVTTGIGSASTALLFTGSSNGEVPFYWTEGRLFLDANTNCIQDTGELGLPNVLVKSSPGNHYVLTDSLGDYWLEADSGNNWIVPLLPTGSPLFAACLPADSLQINVVGYSDTVSNQDFALSGTSPCPYMQVDLVTPFIRSCDSSFYYTVEYCNLGGWQADSAYVIVELDTSLSVLSSSIPFIQQGPNEFRFDLGTVPVGGCGSFRIYYAVACQHPLGTSICSSAHIYPDSSCFPADPAWSEASIGVEGTCLPGDTIQFRVSNDGAGNMVAATGILIAEDDLLKSNFTVLLNAGLDTILKIPGNGSAYTLLAEQVPFHPGNSHPQAYVEGCGVDQFGMFSLGFGNQFGEDDQDHFIAIDCQELIGAYDPNDKRGFPLGVGAAGEITLDDNLEYMIRFQNTGTDTAFRVIIYDRLPEELDISSVVPGVGSHDNSLEFLADRTLRWTFNDINLLDSNANEAASHGFVKFTIDLAGGLVPGDQIRNSAHIIFDYNLPIYTDSSLHTIATDLPEILSVSLDPQDFPLGLDLTVWPNPTRDRAHFKVGQGPCDQLTLEVYNLKGQLKRKQMGFQTDELVLRREGLPTGIYLFRLTNEAGETASGKLIVQ